MAELTTTKLDITSREMLNLMLTTVRNWRFSSGSALQLYWNHCNWLYHIKKPNSTEHVGFWPVPHCCYPSTMASIEHLSYDHITIWYIPNSCSCSSTVASWCSMCDAISIGSVGVWKAFCCTLFHSYSKDSDLCRTLSMGGQRASQTASLTSISYSDTIIREIPIGSKIPEFVNIRVWFMIISGKWLRVYVWIC